MTSGRGSRWSARGGRGSRRSDAEDRDTLKQPVPLDGLLFDLLPADQRARVAKALERAADEFGAELCERASQRDRDFAEGLETLRPVLSDLTGS